MNIKEKEQRMAHKRGHKIMAVKGEFKALGLLLMMAVFLSLIPSSGQAAVALPDVQQLQGITMSSSTLWSPGRLTVGGDGTLYVVDSYKDHIVKFDASGSYAGDIPFPGVSAMAVGPDGALYVGSHKDYSVSIIRNGQVAGFLGGGKNEFRTIKDIACDPATGVVYVVDNVGNAVRMFDAAGRDLGTLGGLNLPLAIEVTTDAVYVIDAPVVPDNASMTTASRISIFDKTSYNLMGTIDDYGKGQMFRPTDLAVAGDIIYVSDAASQGVLLFDTLGVYLGEIKSISGELKTAVSLAISSDGTLYVSSNDTHSIKMFSITAGGTGQQGGQK